MMADDPDPAARRQALSAAKVQIGRSGRFIGPASDPASRRHRHDDGNIPPAIISSG
jgi:hypothetical protein